MSVQTVHVDTWRVSHGSMATRPDRAAVEEPLEVRIQGSVFLVTMRTPGADADLATGLLLAERIIRGWDDVGAMRYCTDTIDVGNVLDVTLTGDALEVANAVMSHRRLVTVTSACGVCGRRTIDDLMTAVPRVSSGLRVSSRLMASLPAVLRSQQAAFDSTGGLHAALLVDGAGAVVAAAEDVGRHNAVDKVIGAGARARLLPLHEHILFVSGRTSFEIVQKAVVAGVPVVAAVSAPSSLAIDLARHAGVTLVGFVRGDTFNIYTWPERVE